MTEPALAPALRPFEGLGRWAVGIVESLGRFGSFLGQAIAAIITPPFKFGALLGRIHYIGFRSLLIILLTGAFTGSADFNPGTSSTTNLASHGASDVFVVDFTSVAQSSRSYEEYTRRTAKLTTGELPYIGIALCGSKTAVDKITGSLPLYR